MSQKQSTDALRAVIASYCAANMPRIEAQFVFDGDDEKRQVNDAVVKPGSWRRMGKRRADNTAEIAVPEGSIERSFNCAPLDDQLRAYVYTDAADEVVVGIHVQGE